MSEYPPAGYEIKKEMFSNLGETGLKVSKIILGCMSFGDSDWGTYVVDKEEEVFKVMKALYDVGIRTFDTADAYSSGNSEILVGKFIKKYDIPRENLVILTKVFFPSTPGWIKDMMGPFGLAENPKHFNRMGLSRKHIMDAVDASVKRLGTYIDVYQIHRYDKYTPAYETMSALNDCINSGKVRYIGASTMRTYQFLEYQHVAEKHNFHKFISMQNFHNLLYREEEREMIPYCKKNGVGLIPWSPIAAGLLARPKDVETGRSNYLKMFFTMSENTFGIIDRVEEIAKKRNTKMATVAIAWSLKKGDLPIVGLNKVERIADAVAAIEFELTDEEVAYLEELYQPVKIVGEME